MKTKIALPVGLGVLWDLTNFIMRQRINTMCSSVPRTFLPLYPVNHLNLRRIIQISKPRGVIPHFILQKMSSNFAIFSHYILYPGGFFFNNMVSGVRKTTKKEISSIWSFFAHSYTLSTNIYKVPRTR